jgi:cell division protease FtsH
MHAIAEPLSITRQADSVSLPELKHGPSGEAKALARLLQLSTLPELSRRMLAVFLGQEVEGNCFRPPDVVMRLMSQCLEGFVRESGGEVVHATNFVERNEERETTPVYQVVTTDAGTFRFLADGCTFIQLPDERVVIAMHRHHIGGEIECKVAVYMAGDSRPFYQRWSAYTREHHYLKGCAAFVDGEPIIHSRRYTWDDVVLPDSVRATLRIHVETFLAHANQLRAAGMKGRRGLILAGPPGTGKTLIGKVLADTLGVPFLWVLPRHVRSPGSFAEIIAGARFLSPAVIFFEDLDLFGEDRDTSKSAVLGELMNQLDGVNENSGMVAIATTNRLEVVERALRNRPGRFDRVLKLGLPDVTTRRKILRRLVGSAELADSELVRIADATSGYSPAQLEEVVNTIHLLAAESSNTILANEPARMTPELIDRAVSEIGDQKKPSIGFQHNCRDERT